MNVYWTVVWTQTKPALRAAGGELLLVDFKELKNDTYVIYFDKDHKITRFEWIVDPTLTDSQLNEVLDPSP